MSRIIAHLKCEIFMDLPDVREQSLRRRLVDSLNKIQSVTVGRSAMPVQGADRVPLKRPRQGSSAH
ncbi:hypothetical protein D3227_35995 [Mesorhizobium waimense]|uniref:Uncharacterized protein n=1 Tax=Mesorhizobium waimense TaxID=1300307 RepID=A0A3A5K5I3_9HYPH|nr:hypothetical protein D3227_35995 [Mesorhizobium waimense]